MVALGAQHNKSEKASKYNTVHNEYYVLNMISKYKIDRNFERRIKGIGSVYKWHPVTKFEHGNHGASKRKFNHMTVY